MHVLSGGRDTPKTAGANSVRSGDVDAGHEWLANVMSLQVDVSPSEDHRVSAQLLHHAAQTTWERRQNSGSSKPVVRTNQRVIV